MLDVCQLGESLSRSLRPSISAAARSVASSPWVMDSRSACPSAAVARSRARRRSPARW
ncbi:hypothetical protein ACFQYP_52465 [Nonomuraea antimicrobica]